MKIRTHSGAKKRVKITGKGKNMKFTFDKAAKRHLMVNKSKGQKRLTLTKASGSDYAALRKLLQR
mgnify:CR=1 FL=1